MSNVLSGSRVPVAGSATGVGSDFRQWRGRSGVSPDSLAHQLCSGAYCRCSNPSTTLARAVGLRLTRLRGRRSLRRAAIAELRRGVLGAVGHRHRLNRSAIRAYLSPNVTEFGGVEAHADDRIAAPDMGLGDQPVHRLVATLGQVLRHALQLTAEHRLEAGADLGERVTRSDGEAEHLPAHSLDFPTGKVVGGDDQHGRPFSRRGWMPAAAPPKKNGGYPGGSRPFPIGWVIRSRSRPRWACPWLRPWPDPVPRAW